MRALNPFTGEFYLETLHVARYTREMYCLFGGRHTHPSTIMPGGCSADITHQTCTDYYVRLMRYFDYVKRSVPMHDDLYDFFLQELPGYDMVGYRETNLVNWGSFDDPDYVDYDYRNMTEWGRKRYITPGVVIGGELISTDLVEINLMIRILLGSSYFDGWENEPTLRDPGSARQPRRQEPSVEQGHAAAPAEARLHRQVHVGRLAADLRQAHRHARLLRHRRRAVRAPVVHGEGRSRRLRLRQGDRALDPDGAAALAEHARDGARVEGPGEVQRDRARPRAHLPPGIQRADRAALPRAGDEGGAGGAHQELEQLQGSRQRGQLRLPRGGARRALPPHGDPDGKIANYQPYPPTPWNASPRDVYGTPGPYEDAVQNTPIFEENGPENFKGIDIMRAVRSFDPCLPCGVHMYTGERQGAQGDAHADGDGLDDGDVDRRARAGSEHGGAVCARAGTAGGAGRRRRFADAASSPRSWSSAVVQMYGEGLERILGAPCSGREHGRADRGCR